MKVVQINTVYNYGSTGRIVSDIHNELIKQGHESYVFYGRGEKSQENNVIKMSNFISVLYDVINTRLFNKHGLSNKNNTRKLISFLQDINPDVIHLHNLHGYYLNYEILFNYLEEIGIPIVWLLHDQWTISGGSATFEKKCHFEKNNLEEMEGYLKILSKSYPRYFYFNSNSFKRNLELKENLFNIPNLTIITPSHWLKDMIKDSYFCNNDIKVIPNGISIDKFTPHQRKVRKEISILGVANIWDESKGLNFFNRLAEDLESNYKITLVGIDSKQKKIVNPRINTVQRTKSINELAEYYSEADVFVNPTLADNFPTTNIEAQACGTPVITFDTGGSGESIFEGVGMKINSGDYNSLLASIRSTTPKTQKQINLCRANAEKYSKERMVKEYLLLYNNIIKIKIL